MNTATELIEPEAQSFLGAVLWDDARTAAFRLDTFLGGGGMSLTFLATRRSSDSEGRAVVKLMRPSFLKSATQAATLAMRKEAEALRRLNARTPPNPFIVRLIDVATLRMDALEVPWLALEYVHGGEEGTTLGERIVRSIEDTGRAFDVARITRVMDQLRSALAEVHAAGVIHRDLKPENVLVCGSGNDEILKVADFGIARSTGMEATFGVGIGTLGFAAPEQLGADPTKIGTWTDVFGLAATMFVVIAGLEAFDASKPRRRLRSLTESPHLSEELRSRPSTLRELDELFQRALSGRIEDRPQTVNLFAAALLGTLAVDSRPLVSNPPARRRSLATHSDQTFRWSLAHRPSQERVIRGVAWNSDGRCLAATGHGLEFWNGEQWIAVPVPSGALRNGMRLVRRLSPGEWLIGGDEATLALFGTHGLEEVLQGPDPSYSIQLASGDLDDLAVLVFVKPGAPPALYCLSNGRWLKPLPLDGVSNVNTIARVGDAEWFLAGRKTTGEAFAAHYFPLFWEVREVEVHAGAILGCAAQRDSGTILAGTVDGAVFSLCGGEWTRTEVIGRPAIAAVALDPLQRGWLGTPGRLWLGFPERRTPYVPVWTGDGAPIVSIYADAGVVFAMTADGAIIEGRPELRRS